MAISEREEAAKLISFDESTFITPIFTSYRFALRYSQQLFQSLHILRFSIFHEYISRDGLGCTWMSRDRVLYT